MLLRIIFDLLTKLYALTYNVEYKISSDETKRNY